MLFNSVAGAKFKKKIGPSVTANFLCFSFACATMGVGG